MEALIQTEKKGKRSMKGEVGVKERLARLALLVLLVTATAAACTGRSTPPGANKYLGSFDQGGYLFLRWQAGLEVMIWHDVAASAVAHSAGSTEGRVYGERGSARSADGRSFEWELQTTDGKTGQVRIGKASYDLSTGTLFIVTTGGGTTDVRQLDRDLSAVPLDHDAILTFAEKDPDLAASLNADLRSP
jgi:hypothetical protein